ncbi:MAG TPA: TolC family protein [Candidatus Angelobacter sp.]|nr:TolC family protein [Candidatus Angelobacter sp.]
MMPRQGVALFTEHRLRKQLVCLSILLNVFLAAAQAGGQTTGTATPGVYTAPAATSSTPSAPLPAPASSGQAQSPFQGSVPTGQATGTTLALTLKDAFSRALQYNLGAIQSNQNTRAAHAERLRNLSALLPNLYGQLSGAVQQINLQAQGLRLNTIPGVPIPTLVGPFSVQDARAYLSQKIFNWSDIKNWKSASESETAALYSYKSDRDLVVLVTATAYLQVVSDAANVESNRAQVRTNQAIYDQNLDLNKHGVIADIDVLRAKVQLQTQQQQLIAVENQLAIDKLTLARIIGLPNGQQFQATDTIPYSALTGVTLEQALQQAQTTRSDYLAAKAQVRAAELAQQGAAAENYPSVGVNANYGDIGSPNFNRSHGTFSVAGTVTVPLFLGTQVRADKLKADATLQNRKAQLADLGGKIDTEVRTAFFNLNSSGELVTVAQSNIELANQTLTQSQDRFRAGVTNNLEVVQAQQAVAAANQAYIASLYSYNAAKISLAQAIGVAEQSGLEYLGVK